MTSGYRGLVSASAYKIHIEEAYNAATEGDFNLVEVEESYKQYADAKGMSGHVEVEIPDPNSETQKIFDRLEEKRL